VYLVCVPTTFWRGNYVCLEKKYFENQQGCFFVGDDLRMIAELLKNRLRPENVSVSLDDVEKCYWSIWPEVLTVKAF